MGLGPKEEDSSRRSSDSERRAYEVVGLVDLDCSTMVLIAASASGVGVADL